MAAVSLDSNTCTGQSYIIISIIPASCSNINCTESLLFSRHSALPKYPPAGCNLGNIKPGCSARGYLGPERISGYVMSTLLSTQSFIAWPMIAIENHLRQLSISRGKKISRWWVHHVYRMPGGSGSSAIYKYLQWRSVACLFLDPNVVELDVTEMRKIWVGKIFMKIWRRLRKVELLSIWNREATWATGCFIHSKLSGDWLYNVYSIPEL